MQLVWLPAALMSFLLGMVVIIGIGTVWSALTGSFQPFLLSASIVITAFIILVIAGT